jgi:hypothetical protein
LFHNIEEAFRDAYVMHGDSPAHVAAKIADMSERRDKLGLGRMQFGVSGYAFTRDSDREVKRELERITNVQQIGTGRQVPGGGSGSAAAAVQSATGRNGTIQRQRHSARVIAADAARLPLAHSSAETHRHLDLFWCELGREVSTRYMGCMEARTFQSAAAQVESAKISLPKVAVGKVEIGDLHTTQIDAAKVAPAKVARLAGLTAPIELVTVVFAQ